MCCTENEWTIRDVENIMSDLLWERAEETCADGRTGSAAFLRGEKKVRAALSREAMAPVFSGNAKQFAAGLVGLILSRQGSWYLLVVLGLGSFMS